MEEDVRLRGRHPFRIASESLFEQARDWPSKTEFADAIHALCSAQVGPSTAARENRTLSHILCLASAQDDDV